MARERRRSPEDSEKAVARRRSSAAKLCSVALYASICAPLAWCIAGPISTGPLGLMAVMCGIVGLVRLRNLPAPPPDVDERPGMVRHSARMARSAPLKAWIGIALGGLALLFSIAIVIFVGVALVSSGEI